LELEKSHQNIFVVIARETARAKIFDGKKFPPIRKDAEVVLQDIEAW
jgi:hypothetical protein